MTSSATRELAAARRSAHDPTSWSASRSIARYRQTGAAVHHRGRRARQDAGPRGRRRACKFTRGAWSSAARAGGVRRTGTSNGAGRGWVTWRARTRGHAPARDGPSLRWGGAKRLRRAPADGDASRPRTAADRGRREDRMPVGTNRGRQGRARVLSPEHATATRCTARTSRVDRTCGGHGCVRLRNEDRHALRHGFGGTRVSSRGARAPPRPRAQSAGPYPPALSPRGPGAPQGSAGDLVPARRGSRCCATRSWPRGSALRPPLKVAFASVCTWGRRRPGRSRQRSRAAEAQPDVLAWRRLRLLGATGPGPRAAGPRAGRERRGPGRRARQPTSGPGGAPRGRLAQAGVRARGRVHAAASAATTSRSWAGRSADAPRPPHNWRAKPTWPGAQRGRTRPSRSPSAVR
jgi:hypothetical protein